VYSRLTLGLFLICLARKPNLKELKDSLKLYKLGEMLIIKRVFEFPPKLSCSNLVSFESLYGMWDILESVNAFMTFPRADRLLLICLA
jgi:hypothetical protein